MTQAHVTSACDGVVTIATSPTAPRIALIHALSHSIIPINEAFERMWPDATRMNLLDDSLSADLARRGALDEAITNRFLDLSDYARGTGADAILFTCSAFGPCIERVAMRHHTIPVLKPNEAMVARACALGSRIGLIATFEPTLRSMPAEFPKEKQLVLECVPEGLAALNAGDPAAHDMAVLRAAQRLTAQNCDVIALTQFSMARAALLLRREVDVDVLTTVESAVTALRKRLIVSH
jgi:Asp/Glu/hydantoin racemase